MVDGKSRTCGETVQYREAIEPNLVNCASGIADKILRSQVRAKDGSPAWLGPMGYGTALSPLQFVKLGPHLYHGTTGIAFFLAAMGHVTGRNEFSDTALQAIGPLRRKIANLVHDPGRASKVDIPIGGMIGLGSFIYGLLRIGEWLDEPSLLREAHEITHLLTIDRIRRDQRPRIQTGSAGAILALLALHKVLPEPNRSGRSPLDIARDVGRHLIETQISYEGRPKAWPLSPGKPPFIGVCYGAAGTSCALLRLFEASPQPEFWDAALEGWRYVRSYYRAESRCWLDARLLLEAAFSGPVQGTWRDWWFSGTTDTSSLLPRGGSLEGCETDQKLALSNKWCHGAPGLAMARLATISILESPEIWGEVEGALAETRLFLSEDTFDAYLMDDLCCGHMGRAEALLYAAQQLGDRSLLEAARGLAYKVACRAEGNGFHKLTASRGTEYFSPSLFQGHAGVGYTFLRLARPGDLPCLVLLE